MLRGFGRALGQGGRCYQTVGAKGKGRVVDLRSDTVTQPCAEMRSAMASAEVGDDVLGEDPTIARLEEAAAGLLGKASALFVPTGCMANLLALMAHCRERGSEVVVGAQQHIHKWEQGSAAQLAGLSSFVLPNRPDGTIDLADLRTAIRDHSDFHQPRTALLCLENTHNGCGGKVLPPAYKAQVLDVARQIGCPVHIDGARLYNAAVASGCSVGELASGATSVSMCLSKGLGAPVGSVLAGPEDFVARARRHRKALGGGIRQGGVLAAAGLIALSRAEETLTADHRRAQALAEGVAELGDPRVGLATDVQTNIIMLRTAEELPAARLAKALGEGSEEGSVLAFPFGPHILRWVTHNGLRDDDVPAALSVLSQVLARL